MSLTVSTPPNNLSNLGSASPWETRLSARLRDLFFAGITLVLMSAVLSRSSWMVFIQDDFLYYLKVAQNIAQGNGSTFNQIVPTNGYQPLWLLVLTAISWMTHNPKVILSIIAITDLIAAVATFVLSQAIIRSTGARPLLVFAFAAWTTLYSVTLFFYCMEVTLTIPIFLGVLCMLRNTDWLEVGFLHTFWLGLLLCAMVLSRIDTLIFGALVLTGILSSKELRVLIRPKLVLGVLCGLAPLVAYFLFNHVVFHTWLPISGMAKELKFGHMPSMEPWRVFFHPLAAGYALFLVVAFLLLPTISFRLTAMERVLYRAALIFPFLYYFVLSCVSDWTLWGWYMYPIRIAFCISFSILCLFPPTLKLLQRPLVTGGSCSQRLCLSGVVAMDAPANRHLRSFA